MVPSILNEVSQDKSCKRYAEHTLCGDRATSNAVAYLTEPWVCVHHFRRHCLGAKRKLGTSQEPTREMHTFVCLRLLKNAVILTKPTL